MWQSSLMEEGLIYEACVSQSRARLKAKEAHSSVAGKPSFLKQLSIPLASDCVEVQQQKDM